MLAFVFCLILLFSCFLLAPNGGLKTEKGRDESFFCEKLPPLDLQLKLEKSSESRRVLYSFLAVSLPHLCDFLWFSGFLTR